MLSCACDIIHLSRYHHVGRLYYIYKNKVKIIFFNVWSLGNEYTIIVNSHVFTMCSVDFKPASRQTIFEKMCLHSFFISRRKNTLHSPIEFRGAHTKDNDVFIVQIFSRMVNTHIYRFCFWISTGERKCGMRVFVFCDRDPIFSRDLVARLSLRSTHS